MWCRFVLRGPLGLRYGAGSFDQHKRGYGRVNQSLPRGFVASTNSSNVFSVIVSAFYIYASMRLHLKRHPIDSLSLYLVNEDVSSFADGAVCVHHCLFVHESRRHSIDRGGKTGSNKVDFFGAGGERFSFPPPHAEVKRIPQVLFAGKRCRCG